MIKALVIGLGITLSSGVVFAQAKKAPARKAHATRHGDKKSDPKTPKTEAPTPDPAANAKPAGDSTAAQPLDPKADAKPLGDSSIAPPDPKADTKPSGDTMNTKVPVAAPGGKLKTDEKAGTKLEKGTGGSRDVSASDAKQATTEFQKGNDHLNNGLFPQAVENYRTALSHWDHPAIHYNLALAFINLDQPLEVFAELNKAMEYGPEPITQEKFDHAKEYLKLVEGQLANVEVSCDKIGAKVSVDGKEVFVAPGKYTAKVRVGKHTFYADKQGYNARITAPFIGPGETYRIELKVYTAEELTRYRRKWQNTWFPYVVVGSGAVVGLIAGGLELSAQSSYKDFDRQIAACNTQTGNNGGCSIDTSINSLKDSGDTKKILGYVGYGIAGAAIATGATLAWLNRRQPYQISAEDLENERPRQPVVSITPIVAPDMAGAMVMGRF
jgi:tetratricopeptide (TPR) repeat protein